MRAAWLCGALAAVPAAFLAVFLSQSCGDWHPELCALVTGWTLCGLHPSLARRLCGQSCGWCKADGSGDFRRPEQAVVRWHKVDRVLPNISLEEFERKYKSRHLPVIFENWVQHGSPALASWGLERLVEQCGDRVIGFEERRLEFLKELDDVLGTGPLRALLDLYISHMFGTSVAAARALAAEQHSLRDFVAYLKEAEVQEGQNFGTILHYLALPVSVNDLEAVSACPSLWWDAVLPVWAAGNLRFPADQVCGHDRRLAPNVFLEADGSRAYPPHQHGEDLTHVFHAMLSGAKKFVFWPYSQREKLLHIRAVSTEFGDEAYIAEGVHHRFDLFPSMAETEAWEGTVNEGELLFVPGVGVHVFESVGTSLGLRFTNQDEASVVNGRELLRAGSSAVSRQFVEELARLGDWDVAQPLALSRLAEELGCFRDDEEGEDAADEEAAE